MNKIKNLTESLLILVLAVVSFTTAIFGVVRLAEDDTAAYAAENSAADQNADADFVYLSDYDYVKELNGKTQIDGKPVSYSTYDPCFKTGSEIVLNGCALKSNADGKISLSTGGYDEDGYPNVKKYLKGITACACSVVVYDISAFDYDWFSTYYGVDSKVSFAGFVGEAPWNSSICKFYFYTSVDGENWKLESEENPAEVKGYESQAFIKFSVRDKNYIKLVAVPAYEGTQANHAVYANPMMFNEGFVFDDTPYDFIKTVEECDEIIKSHSNDVLLSDYEDIILTRKFVSFFGYVNLQDFAHVDGRHKNVIKWILHDDLDALRYFVTGGMPQANAANVAEIRTKILNILYTLYTAHGEDINDTTPLTYAPTFKENATRGDLYKRMIISLSFTHVEDIVFRLCGSAPGNPPSDPLFRYETYKKFHDNGWLKNEVFERLTVPEMRQVLNIEIRDDELDWLSWYVRVKKNGNLSCHAYMPYAGPGVPSAYRHPANYDKYNAKYNLSDFNLSYGEAGVTRLWMLYEKGAYCGGISLNGMVIQKIVGVPSVVISQYNHLAYLFQTRNAEGKAAWASFYDIFGVANSAQAEGRAGSVTNWGTKGWNDTFRRTSTDLHAVQCTGSATYTHYVQYVLNDWENYVKAEEIRSLTDMYPLKFDTSYELENYTPTGENAEYSEELIKIFNEVLKYQPKHLYGWYGLINAYREKSATTVEDYLALAKKITENLYEHPFPMKDLLDLIEPKIKGTKYQLTFSNLIAEAYKKGSVLGTTEETKTDYLQANVTRALAARFLGLNQDKLEAATFSFDGANAGKIVLGKEYQGKGLSWDYSLNGGSTWSDYTELTSVALSSSQINGITRQNGIMIHFNGVSYDAENCFTIQIGKSVLPADTATDSLFGNDLENRVVNVTDLYEWRYSENDAWVSYAKASPDLSGNKSVEVRMGAQGANMASDGRTFTFTEDVTAPNRKYIPVSRISLHGVSSQATGGHAGNAVYALDANYNTRWHSNWNGADTQRFISVKFDKPMFVSAVEFVPAGGGNGKILDGTIYGSLDGVTWRKLAERKNLRYSNQCNTIADANANIQAFDIETPQDVLYIKIVADRASNGNWFTARAFNFFEDTTQEHRPAATIEYGTTDPTNGNVTATLKNLFPDEHIVIMNNDGSDTYTFTENGTFTFTYKNDEGVEGKTTATVTWIDREAPTAVFEYSTTQTTGGKVVVILKPSEEVDVTNRSDIIYAVDENGNVIDLTVEPGENNENVLNGYTVDEEGFVKDPAGEIVANINPFRMEFTENGTFTFEFVDLAGNTGSAKVVVDWIDKSPLNVTLTYDKTEATNGSVTVTVVFDKLAEVINNDGSLTYIFAENGEFTFEYADAAGNTGSITAKVTWIDKTAPVATVNYDKTASTNQNVTATVSFNKQGVTVTNNDGKPSYTFAQNGEFTFEYEDAAGNTGSITAKVDWIVNGVPIAPDKNGVIIECDKTQKDKAIVTITIPGQTVTFVDGSGTFEFTKNGTYEVKYYDEKGTLCSVEVVVDWLDESEKSNLLIIVGVSVGVVASVVVVVAVVAVVIIKKRKV